MPFDYQSNKLTRTLSLRSLRRRSAGDSTTSVSSGSTFGDKLCRQLDAQLRLHSSNTPNLFPRESLTQNQSLSQRCKEGAKSSAQSIQSQDGRQFPCLNSSNRPFHSPHASALPQPQATNMSTMICLGKKHCRLVACGQSHLSRKDSSSSSNSFHSALSAGSSGASSSCQVPVSTSCAGKVKAKAEGWSDFKSRLDSIVISQPISLDGDKTVENKAKSGLRSKFRVFRSKKNDSRNGMHHHLKQHQKGERVTPILENSAIHELPETLSKDHTLASTMDHPRTMYVGTPTSLRVKFDVSTRIAEQNLIASAMTGQRALRPALVRQPSLKRSLCVSSALGTIPEDTSKTCLLSRCGMTL